MQLLVYEIIETQTPLTTTGELRKDHFWLHASALDYRLTSLSVDSNIFNESAPAELVRKIGPTVLVYELLAWFLRCDYSFSVLSDSYYELSTDDKSIRS